MMQLDALLDRRPHRLSGGEQQRVALARALVRRPQAFLMDEPLTNLDAELRADTRTEIKHLQADLGTTMVYVTHDQVEAMSLGHRIAILNKGRVEQVGTPLEVYDRPASLFCASFIGSPPMNLIELSYLAGRSADLPLPASTDLVGIRPDTILTEDPGGATVKLSGIVELYEPIGGESHVHLRLEGSNQLIVAAVPARTSVAEGVTLPLFVRVPDLHPFNRETGRRTD